MNNSPFKDNLWINETLFLPAGIRVHRPFKVKGELVTGERAFLVEVVKDLRREYPKRGYVIRYDNIPKRSRQVK